MVKNTQSNREERSGQWKTVSGITAMLVILFTAASVNAQTYTPLRYWTFENTTNAMKDSSNNYNMDPNYYASPYTINTNASNVGVGRYLSLNSNSGLIKLGTLSIDTAFTVEFLFRPGYLFNTTVLFRRLDDAFDASMGYPYIYFNSTTNNYAGGVTSDIMKVDLNLIGRRSYGYFMDGNWHHMVFKYNSKTGLKQIWVDGECADGYSKTIAPGYFTNTTSTNKDVILNTNVAHVKYNGDYDEMALYTYALPDNQIYKHYQDFVQKKHYTYAASATAAPAPSPVTAPLDVNEFAPGHPSVTISAVDQIAQFPTPRFKPGHTLLQNFNWMDPAYMGGLFQPGVTTTQATLNSTVIQKELAKNFNYYFMLRMDNSQFDTAWVGAANRDPSLKLGIVTFRAQINSNNPDLKSQTKPADHYLQNSSGQYIDANGNVTSNKIWRPTAPTSSYTSDGNNILSRFNNLFSRLNRGIDWVNENGEVFPFPSESAMSKDPVVTAAKNASGLDWPTFLARKYKENETQSFRNIFMAHPGLANAKFTEFGHEGYPPIYGFKYSESRQAGSLINNQYYPTTSFYTRYPYNWRNWTSAWHGWQWIVESRVNELAVGDRLYSPFVAAGWDANEELNIRPAQWLGLMKSLGMTGAEFYYSSFFSLSAPWPDPKNWIWQAAIPPYAQAITSRYEDYLRNGELMTGDVPNNFINPTGPGYSFWAGDLRKLVVVRKHNAANKYAITGTLQPNSSMTGNAENESVAKITLDGQLISFKVRRQGSTYIYDKSNPAAPVFYQLDGWHEATHPSRWTRDFNIEAELFDNTNANAVIRTTVPAGTTAGDYTNHTSYVSFSTASDVTYNFQPRPNAPATQYLWVRARSKSGASAGFTAQFNSGTVHTFNCITDTNWVWYRYNTSNVAVSISGLSTTTINVLKITAINTLIEIDKIAITSNSTAVYGNAGNACTGVQATITASGPTSFCQGGSVNLTANSGSSYLWSNGSTTQAITVTSSGSYTVTVTTNGVGTATSSPVTVTVNALPVATISASGSIAFCQGGSVTLTASSGSSYLWSPGNQTTQSVTVSTAGSYNVRVTNSDGCSKVSSNTTVTVNSLPTATITAGGPVTFCQGGSVTLTSSSGSSYLWSPGNQTTQSISATTGGTYSVRVTNSNGCTKVSSNTVVTVNSLPTATITASGPLNLSTGGSVTLTASAGSSYLWLPGNQTTQSITVNTAGSYTVRVTNSSGCSNTSAAAVVTVGTTGPATITTSGHTSFCQGGSVTLTASSGTSYLWSNGSTAKSITVSASGTYSVTVYNGSTPSVSPAVSVTVWPLPTATITASGATSFCTGGSVTLTASSNSSYYWTPLGQTSQSITATASGTYNVTVTNSNGCTKIASAVPVVVSSCTTCDPPYGLVTSNVSATSATFSWVHPNTGQTQYNVKFKNMNTGYVYVTGNLSYTNNFLTIGVDAGTRYRWWVRSWCGSYTKSAYAGYLSFSTPFARVANAPQVDQVDITEAYLDPENEQDPSMTVYLNEKEVQIFPNPATTSASITFSIQQNERMTLSIMEANGKLISKDVIEAVEGFNIHEMDLGNLPKGMYMVQLTGNGNTTTKRLAVQ